MRDVDLIATPTKLTAAPTLHRYANAPIGPFAELFSLTDQPSLSVPCGFDGDGLPIGLMISGRTGEDDTVLEAGELFEGAAALTARLDSLITEDRISQQVWPG
jgi:aspartyl-tRNA(Asn)/glutamyl-tRNA(Gln) amidotransferase subunit A